MQANEKLIFFELLNNTAEMYNKTLSASLLNTYWDDLKDFNLDDIRNAVKAHRRDGKVGQYMPKTADIMKVLEGWNKKSENKPVSQGGCTYQLDGMHCPHVGTMSNSTGKESHWLCREHWRAQGDAQLSEAILRKALANQKITVPANYFKNNSFQNLAESAH